MHHGPSDEDFWSRIFVNGQPAVLRGLDLGPAGTISSYFLQIMNFVQFLAGLPSTYRHLTSQWFDLLLLVCLSFYFHW